MNRMADLVRRNHDNKKLFNKIDRLQKELNVASDNSHYYNELLRKTRIQMISVHNMVNAKSNVPDSESVDESWNRCFQEIITKLEE